MPRLYLHVGLMKTGTTYLQGTWRANHDALASQGVWYPDDPDRMLLRFAAWDVAGRSPRGADDPRTAGAWQRLLDGVAEHRGDTVLVSQEYFAPFSRRQARRVVEALGRAGHEVHVVLTVRDLARVLPSAWSEAVKNAATATWPEFVAAVADPDAVARDPARAFWLAQDAPAVATTWGSAVGEGRMHVVTVPPAGADRGELLARLGVVVGFDPTPLTLPGPSTNDSLGPAATEVVRRLNLLLGDRLNERQHEWVVKRTIQRRLPDVAPSSARAGGRLALPPEHVAWAAERGSEMARALRDAGVEVTGDLADLTPSLDPGEPVGRGVTHEVADADLLAVALDCLALVSERGATAWWRQAQAGGDRSVVTAHGGGARATAFRTKRALARWADRSPLGTALMRLYLRTRGR